MLHPTKLPIAVFDSGIGGLTVLKALKTRFPRENFIYLGDTARLPYGIKSSENIRECFEKSRAYFNQRIVKALVVACNSTSSVIKKSDYERQPLYTVIEPGAQAAAMTTKNQRVGIIATRATVQSGVYPNAIGRLNPDIECFQQPCGLLVPLVEEGWGQDPLTNLVIHRYVSPLVEAQVDTILLGCTHLPLLKPVIQKIAGPEVNLIDSAEVISHQLSEDLKKGAIPLNDSAVEGELEILCTDATPWFLHVAHQLLEGLNVTTTKTVHL